MRYSLFHLERDQQKSLQTQIREILVSAMLAGQLPADAPVPSTRAMAKRLKVSRNTVMLAYQALASDGYLISKERSGFYVSSDVRANLAVTDGPLSEIEQPLKASVDWQTQLKLKPSAQHNIVRPSDWNSYTYPFIYGQVDPSLFPITAWRDCVRQTLSLKWLDAWTEDHYNADDPMLIEQIQQRILTRRGVIAEQDEILVTMGSQNALYMLVHLLVNSETKVAMEDPGYADMRNMLSLRTHHINYVPIDQDGIMVDQLGDSQLVFVTPSHQYPTNITMSAKRRHDLLTFANEKDALIIEDDYENETNFREGLTPALKSLDRNGRVLYVGSLSKSLMPGVRIGFLVAPKALIQEVRALRRFVLRHPPGNNQRAVALFLSLGVHNSFVNRLSQTYQKRFEMMNLALAHHFHGWYDVPKFGGTSFWLKGPEAFDARQLSLKAQKQGILIEPGGVFFSKPNQNEHYFRMGFSFIKDDKIAPGVELLARIVDDMQLS